MPILSLIKGVGVPFLGGAGGVDFHAFGAGGGSIIKALVRGTGPTKGFERDTVAWIDDHEGLIREVPAHCMRPRGARIVENLAERSPQEQGSATIETVDYDNAEYRVNGLDATQTQRADWVTRDLTTVLEGKSYRNRLAVKGEGANIGKNVLIIFRRHAGGSGTQSTKTVTLTSEYQIISTDVVIAAASNIGWRIRLSGAATNNATSCVFKQGHIQEVTGQANQAPGEYVPVGVGTGSELYIDANAISLSNETDATTGLTDNNLDVFESQTAVVDDGSYAIHAHCNDNPSGTARFYQKIDARLVDNKRYVVSINLRHVGTGGLWKAGIGSGQGNVSILDLVSVTNSDTTFETHTGTFVCPSGDVYLVFKEQNASNNGGVYVESVTIKEADHGLFCDGVRAYAKTNPCQVDGNGVVTETAATTPITDWQFWFEPAATNECLYSEDLSNAAWVASNITKSSDGVDLPNGRPGTAETLTASAGNGTLLQTITLASQQNCYSVYLQRKTGTGNIDITHDNGATWTTKALTGVGTWDRVDVTGAAAANPVVGVRIVTSGDAIQMTMNQLEAGAIPTIYTGETTSGSVTRSADDPSGIFDYTNWSQTEGTWYMDFWVAQVSISNELFNIANSASGVLYAPSTQRIRSFDGTSVAETTSVVVTVAENQYRAVVDFGTGSTIEVGGKDIDGAGDWFWDDTPPNYDGAYATNSVMNIAYNLSSPIGIRDFKGYTARKGKDWVEANL